MKQTKNKIFTVLLSVLFLMAFTNPHVKPVEENEKADIISNTCSIQNNTFQDGEEIVYKLYYNWNFVWLAAGEVTFKVKEYNNKYHVSAEGRTYSSYEWFFKVRDTYESYLDKQTLLPHTSIRDVHEGKYTLYEKVDFDQNTGKAVSLRGRTKSQAEEKSYQVESCMHDILSIIYYSRNIDFDGMSNGSEIPIKIFMDKEVWPLKVTYKGKETNKKIKGRGKFNTIKFSPEVIKGEVFKEEDGMSVWVSDDQNRIPLMIESPVSVGSVKAVLKNYKGLKYDLSSKVKK